MTHFNSNEMFAKFLNFIFADSPNEEGVLAIRSTIDGENSDSVGLLRKRVSHGWLSGTCGIDEFGDVLKNILEGGSASSLRLPNEDTPSKSEPEEVIEPIRRRKSSYLTGRRASVVISLAASTSVQRGDSELYSWGFLYVSGKKHDLLEELGRGRFFLSPSCHCSSVNLSGLRYQLVPTPDGVLDEIIGIKRGDVAGALDDHRSAESTAGSDNSLGALLPDDWVVGHQVGILAYMLGQEGLIPDVRMFCVKALAEKLDWLKAKEMDGTAFPLSTLHLLSQERLADELPVESRSSLDVWKPTYRSLTSGRMDAEEGTPRPSQINGARLVAHQILYSDARAKAVVEAYSAFLSEEVNELADSESELKSLSVVLRRLREATSATAPLVIAVNEIQSFFGRRSKTSLLVRNALFDSILSWPLVVFRSKYADAIGATSVPVGVDLVLDDANKVEFRSLLLGNNGKKIEEGWDEYLRDASSCGKALWRAKNGGAGDLRRKIQGASIVFDFTIADRIFQGIDMEPDLSDRSMETYFAQVVLAKAIGRHAGFGAAITGKIGPQRVLRELAKPDLKVNFGLSTAENTRSDANDPAPDAEFELPPVLEEKKVLDWEFEWAAGVNEKKKFVYKSLKYNRFVLPPLFEAFPSDSGQHETYLETNHCRYLSDVADCVQIGGWRQFLYIRCPDVAHSMHKNTMELPAEDSQGVVRCRSVLATATNAVVQLPDGVTASDLFATLHILNTVNRLRSDFPPPSLSWAVVRTTEEETHSRFWHIVLRRALGASASQSDRLLTADNPRAGAKLIAEALNLVTPDADDRGERAPDLLIILGTRNLRSEFDQGLASVVRPLSFDSVVDELGKVTILPTQNKRMKDGIAATRVILVPMDEFVGDGSKASDSVLWSDKEPVARLRAFRFGFTHQMASVILRKLCNSPLEVREKLRDLVSKGYLSYGGGKYHLRSLRADQESQFGARTDLRLANQHFYAALAYAPYLLKMPMPGLNVADALLPENVREAIFHFEKSALHANLHVEAFPDDKEIVGIRKQARFSQQKLMRFFDLPSWGIVSRLSRKRADMPEREAYELALELLDRVQGAGLTPLPDSWGIAAGAAEQYWRFTKGKDAGASARDTDRVFAEIIRFYESALIAARKMEKFAEEAALNVGTHFSAFLHSLKRIDAELMTRRTQLDDEIVEALDRNVLTYAANGAWFAFFADQQRDLDVAIKFYEMGDKLVPDYRQNLVKLLGCKSIKKMRFAVLKDQWLSMDPERRRLIAGWAKNQKSYAGHINPQKAPSVAKRWEEGQRLIVNAEQ